MSLSPDQREYAARLLRKAGEDLATVRALLDNESIADDVIGFHSQQTVEKAIKAVLVIHGVPFRRAHDLGYLLEVAEGGGVDVPEYVAAAQWLTPEAHTKPLTPADEACHRRLPLLFPPLSIRTARGGAAVRRRRAAARPTTPP